MLSCQGIILDPTGDEGGGSAVSDRDGRTVPPPGRAEQMFAPLQARRLSNRELDRVFSSLLGDDRALATARLPAELYAPFDTDARSKLASREYVAILLELAGELTDALRAERERFDGVVGCTPEGPRDAACLERFVRSFVPRALRRPVEEAEVAAWVAHAMAFAEAREDFDEAVAVVVETALVSPETFVLTARGVPVEGRDDIVRLDGLTVAAQVTFFLTGGPPDAAAIERAATGGLETPEQIRAYARELLGREEAREQVRRFHRMWLGYRRTAEESGLAGLMGAEADRLADETAAGGVSWLELFTADHTFANDELAAHYGLSEPGSEELVSVSTDGSDRRGILSFGAFLSSVGVHDGDSDPLFRGKFVRERLTCYPVPDPPDVDLAAFEAAAAEGSCKADRYAAHRAEGSICNSCHQQMDDIGFGLENYDALGRYRTHDDGDESCLIDGRGTLIDHGPFRGPAELGALLAAGDAMPACMVAHLYHFATGTPAGIGLGALEPVEPALEAFRDSGFDFAELLLALVTDDLFLYRRIEEAP